METDIALGFSLPSVMPIRDLTAIMAIDLQPGAGGYKYFGGVVSILIPDPSF